MANVNLPELVIPDELAKDPTLRKFFHDMTFTIYQLWQRTGGGSDNFEGLLELIQDNAQAIADLGFDVIDSTEAYTTTGNEIVLANGFGVSLNASPIDAEQAHITVDKRMITINGNGKTMNGSATIRTTVTNMSLHFVYSASQDLWRIL